MCQVWQGDQAVRLQQTEIIASVGAPASIRMNGGMKWDGMESRSGSNGHHRHMSKQQRRGHGIDGSLGNGQQLWEAPNEHQV